MKYCSNCGHNLPDEAAFCSACGSACRVFSTPNDSVAPETPVTPPAPTAPAASDENIREEQEFLDITYRILRWERKALSICGKVFSILGAVFVGFYLMFALIGMILGEGEVSIVFTLMGIIYASIFGGILLAVGIIELKAADKIPQYLDTLYKDFSITFNRCDNVGMLIFNIFFGEVGLVFFLINFIRMKTGRRVIERIKARQNKI